MASEYATMQYTDDPKDISRVYRFEVRIRREHLLNKYRAFWVIVKYLWKVVRHGKQTAG